MSELEEFKAYIASKSEATKRAYVVAFNKLLRLIGGKLDVCDVSQEKLISLIQHEQSANTRQSLINVAIQIRKMKEMPIKDLETERLRNKTEISKAIKMANGELGELPKLEDIKDYTHELFNQKEWTKFIINWLLLEYNVRNEDLNFKVVPTKSLTADPRENYIWLPKHGKFVLYVRNVYKTAKTYGTKRHTITDRNVIFAIRRIYCHQKHNEANGTFIPHIENLGYYIRSATYKKLGEGMYCKIVINHNRGNLQKLKQISDNRGTDLTTLIENYDVNNVLVV